MANWEYKTHIVHVGDSFHLSADMDDGLNALGADGWELLTVSPLHSESGTNALIYHFRRIAEPKRRAGFQA